MMEYLGKDKQNMTCIPMNEWWCCIYTALIISVKVGEIFKFINTDKICHVAQKRFRVLSSINFFVSTEPYKSLQGDFSGQD